MVIVLFLLIVFILKNYGDINDVKLEYREK